MEPGLIIRNEFCRRREADVVHVSDRIERSFFAKKCGPSKEGIIRATNERIEESDPFSEAEQDVRVGLRDHRLPLPGFPGARIHLLSRFATQNVPFTVKHRPRAALPLLVDKSVNVRPRTLSKREEQFLRCQLRKSPHSRANFLDERERVASDWPQIIGSEDPKQRRRACYCSKERGEHELIFFVNDERAIHLQPLERPRRRIEVAEGKGTCKKGFLDVIDERRVFILREDLPGFGQLPFHEHPWKESSHIRMVQVVEIVAEREVLPRRVRDIPAQEVCIAGELPRVREQVQIISARSTRPVKVQRSLAAGWE